MTDLCPYVPETVNGFEDADGCPDVSPLTDLDGDGISDSIDLCPQQAETINMYQDTDGCPDVVPENSASEKTASDGAFFQWTAIIAAGISAAGGIAAAKYRKR